MNRPLPILIALGQVFCAVVLAVPPTAGERIDPAGIRGSLVFSGEDVPDEALDKFYSFAQGEKAKILVLSIAPGDAEEAASERMVERWRSAGVESIESIHLGDGAAPARAVAALASSTGVWFLAGQSEAWVEALEVDGMRAALSAVVDRGGVVGSAVAGGEHPVDPLGALLPDAVIAVTAESGGSAARVRAALAEQPALLGYEIDRDAALLVRGRRLWAVGSGRVRVSLAASTGGRRDAREIVLGSPPAAPMADLSALRYAAVARQANPFPAAEPPSPKVESGTLIIIGGGGMPKGVVDRFVRLAGGGEASIVVLPTAMPDPISERNSMANQFRKAGAKEVTVLSGRSLREVESEEFLAVLRRATGIWFGGGRQWRFADAYLDTEALAAMHGVLERGGVIMGSSAGASIQADYLARANPLGNRDIMAEGYERGLGFIRGVAIDQHFAERKRFEDMSSLVDRYPQLLGIGIDEGTALTVAGGVGEVSGKGRVHFYDRRKLSAADQPDYESVARGGSYDLVARKLLDAGEVPAVPGGDQ